MTLYPIEKAAKQLEFKTKQDYREQLLDYREQLLEENEQEFEECVDEHLVHIGKLEENNRLYDMKRKWLLYKYIGLSCFFRFAIDVLFYFLNK